jgi:hypothetical protein
MVRSSEMQRLCLKKPSKLRAVTSLCLTKALLKTPNVNQNKNKVAPNMSIHPPRSYNPCRVLGDSSNRPQTSLSLALNLQFLTPNLSASFVTPSIHLRFGLPTLLPSGLSKVIFLHGRLSCIRTICPAHLSQVILIDVTKSVSSYRRYSSSLYLGLHVAPSQIGP